MRNFLWKAIMPLTMALALQGCGECGDGEVKAKKGEQCDDANGVANDGCSNECTLDEICFDNIDNDGNGDFDCNDAACATACAGSLGSACAADQNGVSECDGTGALCADESGNGFPSGYCVSQCDPAAGDVDCAEGGVCVPLQQGGACFDSCNPANNNADCRDGYACTDLLGDGSILACFPACDSNAQCTEAGANGATNSCDTDPNSDNAGFCIPTAVPEQGAACGNGIDDDLDGLVDCKDDDAADCAADAGCLADISAACAGAAVANEGATAGDNSNSDDLFIGSCQVAAGGTEGNEDIFTFTPTASVDIEIVLVSVTDMGVYARSTCADSATEIDCQDVAFPGNIFGSEDTEVMILAGTAGTPVTLFVDAFTVADEGAYTLTITPVICGDGLVAGGEECDDSNLTTGDGCSDVCAVEDGFACDNTVAPSLCTDLNVVCTDETTAIANVGDVTTGDNTAGTNFFNGSCTGGGLEDLFSLVPGNAGETGVLTLTLVSDTDLGVYARTACALNDTELGCEDSAFPGGQNEDTETLVVNIADANAAVAIFVDAFVSGEEGPYTLTAAFVADNCGDGQTTGGEGCDDGNNIPLDGCSDSCQVEDGFACDNTVSPSECTDLNVLCLAATPALLGANTGDTGNANATVLFIPTNAGAVQDCDFPGTGGGAEVLFSFTPLADGNLTLTLDSGADADHAIYVRTDCVDNATEIGCADVDFPEAAGDTSQEVLTIAVTGGTPLTIFVDTFQDDTGTFTLTLQ